LYNATGLLIATISNQEQTAGKYQLDISTEKYNLDAGVYLLKLSTEDGYVSKQMVKY